MDSSSGPMTCKSLELRSGGSQGLIVDGSRSRSLRPLRHWPAAGTTRLPGQLIDPSPPTGGTDIVGADHHRGARAKQPRPLRQPPASLPQLENPWRQKPRHCPAIVGADRRRATIHARPDKSTRISLSPPGEALDRSSSWGCMGRPGPIAGGMRPRTLRAAVACVPS